MPDDRRRYPVTKEGLWHRPVGTLFAARHRRSPLRPIPSRGRCVCCRRSVCGVTASGCAVRVASPWRRHGHFLASGPAVLPLRCAMPCILRPDAPVCSVSGRPRWPLLPVHVTRRGAVSGVRVANGCTNPPAQVRARRAEPAGHRARDNPPRSWRRPTPAKGCGRRGNRTSGCAESCWNPGIDLLRALL